MKEILLGYFKKIDPKDQVFNLFNRNRVLLNLKNFYFVGILNLPNGIRYAGFLEKGRFLGLISKYDSNTDVY